MTNYLFDVDGTLTNSRQPIDKDFKKFFGDWIIRQQNFGNKVFFVTGSDKGKTIEQIGLSLWRAANGSYQCSGNQLYRHGKLIKESSWKISAHLRLDLLMIAEKSPWFGKADINIEERVGMANFTTLGRTATKKQREAYYIWDQTTREREKIVETMSLRYPRLKFSIGGEISIDMHPIGKDKSQVLADMDGENIFFGDACSPNGNDFPIASKADILHHVAGWNETYETLRSLYLDHKRP